jgi:hypothetical protein
MRFNIVSKSSFGGDRVFERLDAEYMSLVFLDLEEPLRAAKGAELRSLSHGYHGPSVNSAFADDSDTVSYVDIDSVDREDGLTYIESILFRDRPSRAKYVLSAGDILVSNVRPERNAIAIIGKRCAGALASSGFTLLTSNGTSDVPMEFVFAFLKTRFGKQQLVRRNRGSMYPAVLSEDVLDVRVPHPPKPLLASVVRAVRKGLRCHDGFFARLTESQELLDVFLQPLGSPPSPTETNREGVDWTVIRRSDCLGDKGAQRLDAEFQRLEYKQYDKVLRSAGASFLLGEQYELFNGGGTKRGDEMVPVLKQAALTNAGVNWSTVAYEEGSPGKGRKRVREEDILLACTAHEVYYVGRRVDFVRDMPESIGMTNVAVADLMVLRPREDAPRKLAGSYVAAFLRSAPGLHQVQRCIRGIRGGHVYADDLSSYVRVPVPPDQWLEQFEDAVARAETSRRRGKLVLQKCFDDVEAWCESLVGKSKRSRRAG